MIVAKEDISLLPAALKFECLVDRAFLVHPAVYALYLRVLCSKLDLAYECYSASLSKTAQDGRPNAAILMLLICYLQKSVSIQSETSLQSLFSEVP